MHVKTFRAPTIALALEQVKKELGSDAIILGNKKLALGEGATVVEIMAAVEPEKTSETLVPLWPEASGLQDELYEIRGMISLLLSSKKLYGELQLERPVTDLYHRLLVRGLDEKQTFLLLRRTLDQLDETAREPEQVLDTFRRQLLDRIAFGRPFDGLSPPRETAAVYTFVGPTGVGKTTTLAKLAAYLKLRRRLAVAVISLDTYRIGATDQLRTYTDILNVPLQVAQNRSEFQQAWSQLDHNDVILVDTIGRNFLHPEHVDDLGRIFGDTEGLHHFLVLSATAKDEDVKQILQRFRPLGVGSLIFTKIDETLSPASIINQLLRFPHPVSYLGTGQRVPEDLVPATPKRLLSFIFPFENGSDGKESHGSSLGTEEEAS